jgi:hypothetical protein
MVLNRFYVYRVKPPRCLMTITKDIVLRALENICDRMDEVSAHHESKTTFERLRLDCNLDGLTNYLMVEINGAKYRNPNNDYWPIAKHQLVGVLKSFIEPGGIAQGDETALLPVIEAIADFLMSSMKV